MLTIHVIKEAMAESNLEAGRRVVQKLNIPFEDLPADRNDSLWNKIEERAGLTLGQLSALKNARCPAAGTAGAFFLFPDLLPHSFPLPLILSLCSLCFMN